MKNVKVFTFLIIAGLSTALFADDYARIAKNIAKNAPELGKTKIAVLPFSYVDSRQSVAGRIISERLNTAMVETKKFSVVERALIDKLLAEQRLGLTGAISDDSAQKIGNLAGAGAILTGSMTDLKGGRIEVNVRLIQTETGKIFSSAKQVIERDWIDMVSGVSSDQKSVETDNLPSSELNRNKAFNENEEGLKLLRQNQSGEAVRYFTRAIESNPAVGTVYNNRGVAYFKSRDYRKAIQDFSTTIEHEPENAVAFNNRGAAALNLNELDRALENFAKAIELAPDYADAFANSGDVYFRKGNYDKALQDYTQALHLNSEHLQARTNRGSVYMKLGQPENALKDYTEAIENNPELAEPYINRGFVNFDLKKYENSARDFNTAIKKDSQAKEGYAGLGLAYLKQGKIEIAKSAYKKAVALDSRYKGNITALTLEGHFYTPNQIAAFREMELALK